MKYQNYQYNIGHWTNGSYIHAVEMKTIDVIVKKKSKGNEESSLFTAALPHAISRLSITSPWYFHLLFPKIWSYTLDGKWKMIFLKNMIFSSNFLKRWSFQRGLRRHMIFLVLSEKIVFFPENMIFFPWSESEEGRSQEIHENMMHCPTAKKNMKPNI